MDKKDEVVSLLQVQPNASNQVLLKVRFAEVSRNAMSQLSASVYSDGYKNTIGSVTTAGALMAAAVTAIRQRIAHASPTQSSGGTDETSSNSVTS